MESLRSLIDNEQSLRFDERAFDRGGNDVDFSWLRGGFPTLSPELSFFFSQIFVTSLPCHVSKIVLLAEHLSTVLAFFELTEFFSARCAFGQLSAPPTREHSDLSYHPFGDISRRFEKDFRLLSCELGGWNEDSVASLAFLGHDAFWDFSS